MSALDPSAFPEVRVVQGGGARPVVVGSRARSDRHQQLGAAARVGLPACVMSGRSGPRGGLFYGTPKGAGPAVHLLNNWPETREVTVPSTRDTVGRPARRRASIRPCSGAQPRCRRISRGASGAPDFTIANDRAVEPERPAAARPIVGRDDRVRRLIVAPSPAPLQHQRRGPGRQRHRARTADDSVARRDHDGRLVGDRQLPRAGNHGRQATEPRRAGLALVYLEPFDRRRARSTPGPKATWSSRTGATSAAIAGTRASTGVIGWWRTQLVDLPFGAGRRWLGSEASSARCSATGSCRRSCRCSRAPGSMWRFSTRRTASASRPAAACGGPISSAIRACRDPTADAWLNAAAFAVPQNADGTYRYGNLGRNSLLGPGYFNLDAGLTQDIRLGGARRLQIRWEVFNRRPTIRLSACRTPTWEAPISARSGRP